MTERTNCKNCGAPLKDGRCKYCGTEYKPQIYSMMEVTADWIKIGVLKTPDYPSKVFTSGVF